MKVVAKGEIDSITWY
ncbi:hypothetical protein [Staphylococcus aureus]